MPSMADARVPLHQLQAGPGSRFDCEAHDVAARDDSSGSGRSSHRTKFTISCSVAVIAVVMIIGAAVEPQVPQHGNAVSKFMYPSGTPLHTPSSPRPMHSAGAPQVSMASVAADIGQVAAEVNVLRSALTEQGGYEKAFDALTLDSLEKQEDKIDTQLEQLQNQIAQMESGRWHASSSTIAFFLGSILGLGGIWSMMRNLVPKRPVVQPSFAVAGVPDSHNLAASMTATPAPVLGSTAPRRSTAPQMSATLEKPKLQSEGAAKQVGNDAFLNVDLMDRAMNGPGVVNDSKLKIGIVGAGLAGMVAAMDLVDAGHEVEIFEVRPFVGGKVSSWQDKDGNHIEMGLHVFFGCYYNLFGIMQRVGAIDDKALGALRLKEHTHTFINDGGGIGELDFRFPVGAPVSGLQAFFKTEQLDWEDKLANALRLGTSPIVRALVDFDGGMDMVRELDDITFTEWFTSFGGSRGSIERMWNPIAYALGFIDCDQISARCMLTIFMLFAIRTEASVLRMLDGSPQTYLHDPIIKYLEDRGVKINLATGVRELVHEVDDKGMPTRVTGIRTGQKDTEGSVNHYDAVVAAVDLPGIKKLMPDSFRKIKMFDNVFELDCVPIATVQLRFDGWVTEMNDKEKMMHVDGDFSDGRGYGIDNLLYSADAEFSCFADLALTSPAEYYKEGEGSLIQAVFDSRAYDRSEEQLVADCEEQVHKLFPSSSNLKVTWSSVVKLGQSLYREKPGQDKYRPTQATPIDNFFMCGSYTYQDYIDSMEGATKSGLMVADEIVARADGIAARAKAASEKAAV